MQQSWTNSSILQTLIRFQSNQAAATENQSSTSCQHSITPQPVVVNAAYLDLMPREHIAHLIHIPIPTPCEHMCTWTQLVCSLHWESHQSRETQGGTHVVTVQTNKQLRSVATSSTATSRTTLTTCLTSSYGRCAYSNTTIIWTPIYIWVVCGEVWIDLRHQKDLCLKEIELRA